MYFKKVLVQAVSQELLNIYEILGLFSLFPSIKYQDSQVCEKQLELEKNMAANTVLKLWCKMYLRTVPIITKVVSWRGVLDTIFCDKVYY